MRSLHRSIVVKTVPRPIIISNNPAPVNLAERTENTTAYIQIETDGRKLPEPTWLVTNDIIIARIASLPAQISQLWPELQIENHVFLSNSVACADRVVY